MKKITEKTLRLIFIVSFIILFSGKLYSQSDIPVNIYTPRGSLVPSAFIVNDEHSPAKIRSLNNQFMNDFPYATLLDSASKKYNCHAYAWYGDTVWINASPSIYWLDGSYEEVSEACAYKVRYSGNHSAVTTSTPNVYISKWGEAPLMMHHKNDVPSTYGTPYKFYARAIEVWSPPELISELSAAQSCCRKVHILGNANMTVYTLVTIPSCVALVINPGANVTFAGGMVVNGSLIANGATLNFNSDLVVNGSLSTSSGATLNFGNGTGLTINGSASCQSTTFTGNYGNWIGIGINSGASAGFNGCEISNGTHGVNVNRGSVGLSGTKIFNTGHAVNLTNYATGSISTNNIFNFNNWDIKCDIISTANAGSGVCYGYNSFRNPGYYQFYSDNPSLLTATGNYWGSVQFISGNIDVSGAFPYDINPAMSPQDDHRAEIESELFLMKTTVKNDEPIKEKVPGIDELDKATLLFYGEKYDEALAEMHRLVDEYKDGYVGKRALVSIEKILINTDRSNEILPMLEKYSNGKSKVAKYAHYCKGYQYLKQNEYNKAIEIMKATEFDEEDFYLRQARLYDLGVIYHDYLSKKAEAYDYFSELVNTYPDCPLAEVAETFYKVSKYNYEKPPVAKEETTVTETKLFANYPNPFNPSTVIKYQLSEASLVSLKVYDVMGREVATLVNSFQNNGSYDVTFNANGLSSGIYFYKLNANGKQYINKMLLIK